jgi:hypothetical protein
MKRINNYLAGKPTGVDVNRNKADAFFRKLYRTSE